MTIETAGILLLIPIIASVIWMLTDIAYIYYMRVYSYILLLYLFFITLYSTGEFLSCYYMIPGSSSWCEPILTLF